MTRCEGCGAEIMFRHTLAGKVMPLDAQPTDVTTRGVYVLNGDRHCIPWEPMEHGYDRPRYMNHWTTCPKRDQFRRKNRDG